MSYVPPSPEETDVLFRPLLQPEETAPGAQEEERPAEPVIAGQSVASLADVALNAQTAPSQPAPPPAAPVAPPQAMPPVQGVPAQAMPAQPVRAYPVAPHQDMTQMPEAYVEWEKSRSVLVLWLGVSIFYTLIGLLIYLPGVIVGTMGIVGSSLHVCGCCRASPSNWASPIRTTYIISTSLVVMEALLSMLIAVNLCFGCNSILGEEEEEEDLLLEEEERMEHLSHRERCNIIMAALSILLIYNCIHLSVSVVVSKRAHYVRQLLNPVSSGIVTL